jgi:hypothetical protein
MSRDYLRPKPPGARKPERKLKGMQQMWILIGLTFLTLMVLFIDTLGE